MITGTHSHPLSSKCVHLELTSNIGRGTQVSSPYDLILIRRSGLGRTISGRNSTSFIYLQSQVLSQFGHFMGGLISTVLQKQGHLDSLYILNFLFSLTDCIKYALGKPDDIYTNRNQRLIRHETSGRSQRVQSTWTITERIKSRMTMTRVYVSFCSSISFF